MMGFRRASRKGQGLSEYGMVLGLVAVVSISALSSTGNAVQGLLGQITGAVASGTNPCDYQTCFQTCEDALGQNPDPAAVNAYYGCMNVCVDSYFAANCDAQQAE